MDCSLNVLIIDESGGTPRERTRVLGEIMAHAGVATLVRNHHMLVRCSPLPRIIARMSQGVEAVKALKAVCGIPPIL